MDEVLIEEVRNYKVLYDLGHPDYKNLRKKEQAWREVAASVKLSEIECKKRWKGLRDSYKRCKRLEQLPSGSSAELPKKKWRYFEALSFLDNVTSSRRTIGNICQDEEMEDVGFLVDVNDYSTDSVLSAPKKRKDSDKFQDFLDLAASS